MWLLSVCDTDDTGCHLMRMELEAKGGSESEETREESTIREMGVIFPKTNNETVGKSLLECYLFSNLANSRQESPF